MDESMSREITPLLSATITSFIIIDVSIYIMHLATKIVLRIYKASTRLNSSLQEYVRFLGNALYQYNTNKSSRLVENMVLERINTLSNLTISTNYSRTERPRVCS